MSIPVLYSDEDLIAVNKSTPQSTQVNSKDSLAGILVGSTSANVRTLYDIHRIDTPVTGVVMYACTKRAAAGMSRAFAQSEVHKVYWAAVERCPEQHQGTLKHYLQHNRKTNRSTCTAKAHAGSRYCETAYRIIGMSRSYCFLELIPKTGRTHQIRAQLQSIGCPVKGDRKYGAKRGNGTGLIHLHARKLDFRHPVTDTPMTLVAEPPQEDAVWEALLLLRRER